MEETNQNLKQKKIALAQSENASVIVELMKDCMSTNPIIAKTEWETIVNAITLEVQGTMLKAMVDLIENIRQGSLYNQQ
jgi:hypothetical protein